MNINQAYPSNYLKKEDFTQPRACTIHMVKLENVAAAGQPEEMKPVLFINETDKGMVLNKTNANILAALYGPETDSWQGKPVQIYNDPTIQYAGQITGGIRFRMPAQPAVAFQTPPDNLNVPQTDDIPGWD